MITSLKKSSYKKTLWKNGLGQTEQIDIFPTESSLDLENFLWRISSAQINSKNNFSIFNNFSRILIVKSGDGLKLNSKTLLPNNPQYFEGEDQIECELIGSAVVDLGIIYRRDQVRATAEVISTANSKVLKLEAGTHYLYLANGNEVSINQSFLSNGDTCKIITESELNINLFSNEESLIYKFSLSTNL